LPARELAALGLGPRDLLEPAGASRALPLYRRLIGLALEHYNVAWDYTLAIPTLEWRMRMACAWPLLIGLATLGELAAHPNPLSVKTPIKISRREVRTLLAQSTVTVWSNRALAAHAARLRARVAV
jgi:farnesyl-diphosphate farnesyltransferase